MIGCHGMSVPPGKVVAATYSATRTGSVQTPNQRASRDQSPFRTDGAYTPSGLVKISEANDVLDTSVVSPEFLCGWRRSGACIARPTREGYRVVCRPRRTPRGTYLGGANRKET